MKRYRLLALALALLLLWGCAPAEAEVPTQAPTQAPTEAPTEPPTEAPTEPPTEPEPEIQLHSGIREDGSFDAGTLFIGDSLTYGFVVSYLQQQDLLGEARYMAMTGAALTVYFDGPRMWPNGSYSCLYSQGFEGMTMQEAVEGAGRAVTAVYLMMGTNHSDGVTEQLYIDVVADILKSCPKATVYLQKIPNSHSSRVDAQAANARIEYAYEYYARQGQTRVQLIDTQSAIDYNLKDDGVHLTVQGDQNWYAALVAYAEEKEIPQ